MNVPESVQKFVLLVLIGAATPAATHGVVIWDGGGAGNNWSNVFNWNPNSLPNSVDDVIISQNVDTRIDQNFTIQGLDLSGGATTDTNGNTLAITFGQLDIGLGTSFIVSEHTSHASGFNALEMASEINIANLGVLEMNGGRIVAFAGDGVNIGSGGRMRGFGELNLTMPQPTSNTVFVNNGSLETGRAAGAATTDRFTLRIASNQPDLRLDLDGINNDRVISLVENTTLELDAKPLNFGGTMTLYAGTIFDVNDVWQTTSTSILNVDANTTSAGVADTATISGNGSYNALNGSQINVNSGKLVIDIPFFANSTAAINVATFADLQFDDTATLDGDLNLGGTVNLIINDEVTVNDPDFDWDGVGIGGVTEINKGGSLTVNASFLGSDNDYDGTININSGELETSIIGGTFTVDTAGNVNMDTAAGNATIRGSQLALQGDLTVTGDNQANINGGVRFDPGSTLDVADDAILRMLNVARFRGGSTHTGAGKLSFAADVSIEGDTTIDMPAGIVALDESGSNKTVSVDNDLTINAQVMGGIGAAGFGTHTIDIANNNATLTVNLTDPTREWSLLENGVININPGVGTLQTSLAGADINVRGRINVNDDARFTARVDLEGGGIIDVGTNSLTLNGGSATDPNTIAAGLIDGNGGELAASGLKALVGFGTINPDVRFTAGADIRAEGGTLAFNGAVVSADVLSAGPGARLLFNNPLNTANVTELFLDGGEVLGQPITNNGAIRGHGTIRSAGLTSLGSISADGGELVIDTTGAPDLDGIGNTTVLNAVTGNLTVVDALTDDFSATANVAAGRTMDFQGGWTQGFAGQLFLTGSVASPARLAGGPTVLRGTTNVSRLAEIAASTTVDATGRIVLPNAFDILAIQGNSTIEAGATFSGAGAILNDGFVMSVEEDADVGVILSNRGSLQVAGAGNTGEVFIDTLDLLNAGSITFDINGTATGNFDSVKYQTAALVDGELEVLLSGFTPSLGDSFPLMTSTSGNVIGTFATTSLPALGSNLDWLVDYAGDTLILEVVAAVLSGDFDNNGDYACNDIDMLVAEIAAGTNNTAFDLTGDNEVDGDDLDAWLAEAGAAELASQNPYPLADANLDGTVNGADFDQWNANRFTHNASWCSGDFNADGAIDGFDLLVWNANKFTSADNNTAAVPEPSATLMVLGMLALATRRRR